MDVTRMLEADHEEAKQLFAKIEKAEGADRQPLIDQLDTALRSHMALEESVLYPAMGSVTGVDEVDEAETEHELARRAMSEVLALSPDEPGFGAALAAARAGIEHHVAEEEDIVFPQLRKSGTTILDQVATPFMAKRLELGMPISADGLAASSTKDELLAEAQNVGIEAPSSMTKDELARALADAMA